MNAAQVPTRVGKNFDEAIKSENTALVPTRVGRKF